MESFLNLTWAVVGASFLAVGFVCRWRLTAWAKRQMARDLMLLGLIGVLLFPVISISDDIGYFSYYFSGGQAPDGIFWVKGSRREKQLHLLPIALAYATLPTATAVTCCQRVVLEIIGWGEPAGILNAGLAISRLRAPPLPA